MDLHPSTIIKQQNVARLLDEFNAEIVQAHENVRIDYLTNLLLQAAIERQTGYAQAASMRLVAHGSTQYAQCLQFTRQLINTVGHEEDRARLTHFVGAMLDTLGQMLMRNAGIAGEAMSEMAQRSPNPLKPMIPPPPALPPPPAQSLLRLRPAGWLTAGKKYVIDD